MPDALTQTFSIVGRDPATGDLGVAVESKYFAVGNVVPWAEGGVGAIATQHWANKEFGPRGLALLRDGLCPDAVLERLLREDNRPDQRQVGIIDRYGNTANHTGAGCQGFAGASRGPDFSAQGNTLAGPAVVSAMEQAFVEGAGEPLAERLVRALEAGQAAGGDARGEQSAALIVVRQGLGTPAFTDRLVDLRVDDHEHPIAELRRLYEMLKAW